METKTSSGNATRFEAAQAKSARLAERLVARITRLLDDLEAEEEERGPGGCVSDGVFTLADLPRLNPLLVPMGDDYGDTYLSFAVALFPDLVARINAGELLGGDFADGFQIARVFEEASRQKDDPAGKGDVLLSACAVAVYRRVLAKREEAQPSRETQRFPAVNPDSSCPQEVTVDGEDGIS